VGRFDRMAVGATRCLILAKLPPLTELALRLFPAPFLSPVLDGRAISAPKGHHGHLIGHNLHSGRAQTSRNRYLPTARIDVRFGSTAENINASTCSLLFAQQRTFLLTAALRQAAVGSSPTSALSPKGASGRLNLPAVPRDTRAITTAWRRR
jgi:hypothetical protein